MSDGPQTGAVRGPLLIISLLVILAAAVFVLGAGGNGNGTDPVHDADSRFEPQVPEGTIRPAAPANSPSKVVRTGETWASPDWAHSVHVEPDRLEPGRVYWYRFRAGDAESDTAIGEAKKLDGRGSFSGAQVGAARSLAAFVLKNGWDGAFEEVEPDRVIKVTRPEPRPTRYSSGSS